MKSFDQLVFEFIEFDYETAIRNHEPISYYKDNYENYFGLHVNTEHMMEDGCERLTRFKEATFPNDPYYKAFLNEIHCNKDLVLNALQHIPTLPKPDDKYHKYVCVMFFQPFIYHMTVDLKGRMNNTIEDEFNDIKTNFPDERMIVKETGYIPDKFYIPSNKLHPTTSHQSCIEIVLRIKGNNVRNKLPYPARKKLNLFSDNNLNKIVYDVEVNTIAKPTYPNKNQGDYGGKTFGYVWNNPNKRNLESCFVAVTDESMIKGFKDMFS